MVRYPIYGGGVRKPVPKVARTSPAVVVPEEEDCLSLTSSTSSFSRILNTIFSFAITYINTTLSYNSYALVVSLTITVLTQNINWSIYGNFTLKCAFLFTKTLIAASICSVSYSRIAEHSIFILFLFSTFKLQF